MWIKYLSLIVLDEPFQGIDGKKKADVKKLLSKLLDTYSGIFVIVTHDINDALMLSKRLFLNDGAIIDILKIEEIFKSTNPEIKKLVLGDVK